MLRSPPPGRPIPDPVQPASVTENGQAVYAQPVAEGPALPSTCLRKMHAINPMVFGGDCPYECPGRQRDGGCLVDIISERNSSGLPWVFEIDREGFWCLVNGD